MKKIAPFLVLIALTTSIVAIYNLPKQKSSKFQETAYIVGIDTIEGSSSILVGGVPPKVRIHLDFDNDGIQDAQSEIELPDMTEHDRDGIEWYTFTKMISPSYRHKVLVKVSPTMSKNLVVITDYADEVTDIDGNLKSYKFN